MSPQGHESGQTVCETRRWIALPKARQKGCPSGAPSEAGEGWIAASASGAYSLHSSGRWWSSTRDTASSDGARPEPCNGLFLSASRPKFKFCSRAPNRTVLVLAFQEAVLGSLLEPCGCSPYPLKQTLVCPSAAELLGSVLYLLLQQLN